MKRDEEEERTGDEWCIASWHCYHGAQLMFVIAREGKPAPDSCTSSEIYQAFKWNSYHAARKFQRSHPELDGYIIVNLSEIQRECNLVRELRRAKLLEE